MEDRVVVAIGFSEGGIDPMKSFFDNAPHDRATYVILRHMPFDQQSHLDKILQRYSKLKIIEVKNNMRIEKDTVYMAPGSMYMIIKNDILLLEKRPEKKLFPNVSIDIFLKSLAIEKGNQSIAVILSGNGGDGSEGSAMIKAAGGMVIVQEPSSCKRSSMPLNVIKKDIADHVLLPEEMPPIIVEHITTILKNTKTP